MNWPWMTKGGHRRELQALHDVAPLAMAAREKELQASAQSAQRRAIAEALEKEAQRYQDKVRPVLEKIIRASVRPPYGGESELDHWAVSIQIDPYLVTRLLDHGEIGDRLELICDLVMRQLRDEIYQVFKTRNFMRNEPLPSRREPLLPGRRMTP